MRYESWVMRSISPLTTCYEGKPENQIVPLARPKTLWSEWKDPSSLQCAWIRFCLSGIGTITSDSQNKTYTAKCSLEQFSQTSGYRFDWTIYVRVCKQVFYPAAFCRSVTQLLVLQEVHFPPNKHQSLTNNEKQTKAPRSPWTLGEKLPSTHASSQHIRPTPRSQFFSHNLLHFTLPYSLSLSFLGAFQSS